MRTKTKAQKMARIADAKKAENIIVLDVRNICNYTDYFILATGQTSNHLQAICGEIVKEFKKLEVELLGLDGINAPYWRVLDYGDVIFHCFTEDTRRYYNLERLWADADKVEWEKKTRVSKKEEAKK
ncbi:MAG TPA: ribosome silencing factor [Candidatus Sumerlaeota bacterium]|nr:MAG: Ribosomal silencing factor RsfS [candidate division BRC1 bacterium ADurb.Bin183]HQH12089.1 ribosome silencing factor [Candidatus Sumerlaeota bacterium]HRR98806.1 ribosome silencing factor [Candidatus Sumerlaeia bacterium]